MTLHLDALEEVAKGNRDKNLIDQADEFHTAFSPVTVLALIDRVRRLEGLLLRIQQLGEEGMNPNYNEWLTFHDKIASIARSALQGENT